MHKIVVLLAVLLLALSSSLFLPICSAIAQPSTPTFTVKVIDSSYDTPASSSIDPYTGQTITTPAQHIENRTIEVKIKNQPFTPYVDDNGFTIQLYYSIRVRGHFAGNWTEVFSVDNAHPVQSNSDYTTISLPLGQNVGPFGSLHSDSSSEIDFQVKAMVGYFSRTSGFASWYFAGQESEWSRTQTLTISPPTQISQGASQPASSTNNPPVGQVFGLDWVGVTVVVLLVVIAVLLVCVVFYLRKRKVG